MELITAPLPYLIGKLDNDLYQLCIDTWPIYKEVNHEGRYNVSVTDEKIVTGLTNVTKKCITKLLPFLLTEYPKWKPSKLNVKFQYAGNIVSDKSYKMRDWHLDNGNKIFIGLWYFKHPDDTDDAGLHISNGKEVVYIPYSENQLVFIPNLTNAWHKVGERNIWTHERRFINIVVETDIYVHDYRRSGTIDSIKSVRNLMV